MNSSMNFGQEESVKLLPRLPSNGLGKVVGALVVVVADVDDESADEAAAVDEAGMRVELAVVVVNVVAFVFVALSSPSFLLWRSLMDILFANRGWGR